MKLILRAFMWYWIICILAQIGFMVFYICNAIYGGVKFWSNNKGAALGYVLLGIKEDISRDVGRHFNEGFASVAVIGPSVACGMIGFIVVLLVGNLHTKKSA